MNSKFKALIALSLAVLVFSADAAFGTPTYRSAAADAAFGRSPKAKQSCFGLKSKVALAALFAGAVYYKRDALAEALKNGYNACTLENGKIVLGKAQDLAVAGYNACTVENGKAVVKATQNAVVNGYNACTLENGKAVVNATGTALANKVVELKDQAVDLGVAGYNACNKENATAVANATQDALSRGYVVVKDATISAGNSIVSAFGSFKNWVNSF